MKIVKCLFMVVVFYSCAETNNKNHLIELDRFTNIQDDGECYFRVLIDNPSENKDSLRIIMVNYFKEKQQHLDSINSKYYIAAVWFYNKTRKTSYFIDHDEDPGGFSSYMIDDYNEGIGYIGQFKCDVDSKKMYGVLTLDKKIEYGTREISRDTLFSDVETVL